MKYSNGFSLFLFFVLTIFTSLPTDASEYLKEIVRANDLYSEKRYAQSAQAYESLINKDVRNGYLYYNLANTYIRMGKTGPAVLNYIHARKWIPRDENLEANLKFAIQQTWDKIEPPPPGTLSTFFFWTMKDLLQTAGKWPFSSRIPPFCPPIPSAQLLQLFLEASAFSMGHKPPARFAIFSE